MCSKLIEVRGSSPRWCSCWENRGFCVNMGGSRREAYGRSQHRVASRRSRLGSLTTSTAEGEATTSRHTSRNKRQHEGWVCHVNTSLFDFHEKYIMFLVFNQLLVLHPRHDELVDLRTVTFLRWETLHDDMRFEVKSWCIPISKRYIPVVISLMNTLRWVVS